MKPILLMTFALAAAFAAPAAAAAYEPGHGHHKRAPIVVDHGHKPHHHFDGFHRGTFLRDYDHGPIISVRNWRACGLYPPRGGFEWVRVRGELLLINLHSGRIVDVVRPRGWRYS